MEDDSDQSERTAEEIAIFLRELDTPCFLYHDVLDCYVELVGKSWAIDNGVKRGPRIPTRSELHKLDQQHITNCRKNEKDDLSDIDEPEVIGSTSFTNNISSSKKKSMPIKWTKEETDALVHGIRRYGWGKWRTILDGEKVLREHKEYRQIVSRAKYLKLSGALAKMGVEIP